MDLELHIKVKRNAGELEFVLMLVYERCVWRLCFGDEVEHVNSEAHPNGSVPLGLLSGSHYHCWNDNRHLGSAAALPKRLKFGRPLQGEICTFAQAFLWFCAENNIQVNDDDIPDLPPPDLLI